MITEEKTEEQLDTPGDRLKCIRSSLHVSRAYLQDKYGLAEATLKSWENGTTRFKPAAAARCAEIYRKEGCIVSEDWIMQGIGLAPKSIVTISRYFATPTETELPFEDDEIAMIRDANTFKESYTNAVVMVVSNDDMRPFYRPGDYIGGKMRYGNDIETLVDKDCIISLKNGERFFRRLIKNNTGQYNITCLNPNETTSEPVLYNVEIEGAAPIIWHRWKDE